MKKWIRIVTILLFANNLSAQNTITTDTILQLSTCAGGNVLVPFSATGTFAPGNVFTAQLSNAFGQFTTPINIGSAPFNLGFILATIPANTNFGFLYKVRVIASNPSTIGAPCPNTLIITQVAQLNQIIAAPNDTACVGDTITLTAINPANSYSWSTGDTSATINVTQTGNYSVTTTDFLGCETDTSKAVVFEVCNLGLEEETTPLSFDVFPNPSNGNFTLTNFISHQNQVDLRIINLLGQTVYSQLKINTKMAGKVEVHLMKKGAYFVEVSEGNNQLRKKLIVQ
ncbi:MAG: T9SS type A sorting domain-containing protein [Crocinitomicaceae bacterium]|mgnify:FL=1|jgi:hypothetical protein|nr:T9SS type A sorting domain-containing protein [Crocinitomicaceae bacterium]